MSGLTVLRSYAIKSKPESLPPSLLFSHTTSSLTLFDAFPKSIFHFIILPRVQPPLTVHDLASLRTLLKRDKAQAKGVLLRLKEDADNLKVLIEEEMQSKYGFKWGIWIGFHAVPSMEHIHLHVLSNDLCSPKMKHKKHYNSFHPEHGFFLPLEDILSWFDADPSYYATMSKLDPKQYEPLLKEDLVCWRCGSIQKNMPILKSHLQDEWDKIAIKGREKSTDRRHDA